MNETKKFSIKWLEKLKKVKHIEIYILVVFIVILLLIYLSSTDKQTSSSSTESTTQNQSISVIEYVDSLEQDLSDMLSSIGGVEDVKVLITLNLEQIKVEDSNITLDTFPAIKGILITAKGLNDTTNKMKVLHAIESVLDVNAGNIELLSSE